MMNQTMRTFEYDDLFSGPSEVVALPVTAEKGQVLLRGTIVAIENGKIKAIGTAGEDAKLYGIAAEQVDAEERDVETTVYVSGTFNPLALLTGGEQAVDELEVSLRELGIYLKSTY